MNRPAHFLFSCMTLSCAVGMANADFGDELGKFTPADGQPGGQFGKEVDLQNGVLLVGSPGDTENGSRAGEAFLVAVPSLTQLHKLVPQDIAANDRFGSAVAISGNYALVGSYRDDDNGDDSGAVYVFDVSTGNELYKLIPADNQQGDAFGISIAMEGTIAIIGASGSDDAGSGSGAVYVFNIATGQQLHKLLPDSVLSSSSQFGRHLDLDGSVALIGAPRDDRNGQDTGLAYLFDVTSGAPIMQLSPDVVGDYEEFGRDVAIHDGIALVRSTPIDESGWCGPARAILFDTTSGDEIHELDLVYTFGCIPNGGLPADGYVALDNTYAYVGVTWFGEFQNVTHEGIVAVFDIESGDQATEFTASDGFIYNGYSAVVVDAGMLVVGAQLDNENGAGSGSAYLIDVSAPCPTDINGDGVTDTADLGILVAQFGSSGPSADLNSDGSVDTADLGILIGAFGGDCL